MFALYVPGLFGGFEEWTRNFELLLKSIFIPCYSEETNIRRIFHGKLERVGTTNQGRRADAVSATFESLATRPRI